MKAGANGNSALGGMSTGALIAAAVGLLALPSAVLAFSSRFEPRFATAQAHQAVAAIQAPRLTAQLVETVQMRSLGKEQMFRFTPASSANRPDRSITVAVRVDPSAARAISARGSAAKIASAEPGVAPLVLAPTAFNLGVSRGYHNFAQGIVPQAEISKIDMPDLATFKRKPGSPGDPSRFSPRIVIDEKQASGRAPRTFADNRDSVDVGGAYSVTRNLDVTAGVRYSQERERLRPLTDGKQDSQAVFVGTQFRF